MLEIVIIIVCNLLIGLLVNYARKDVEKKLDVKYQKEISYEAEKGKNIATKEDIKTITAEIENVKNEISFEKQRNHDFIKERERRLLNILFHAEAIANAVNRLYIYGHNTQDASKVAELIDEISREALQMRQESTICIAAYSDIIGMDKSMTSLVDNIQLLSAELLTRANNVANNITGSKFFFDKASHEDGKQQVDAVKSAMLLGLQNNKLLENPLQYKDVVNHNIEQYVLWLNHLYNNGFAIRHNVELIKNHAN